MNKKLKEAAERFAETYFNRDETSMGNSKTSFIDGAKWQQERMYSEEEVKSILLKTDRFLRADLDKWFEQFKKK